MLNISHCLCAKDNRIILYGQDKMVNTCKRINTRLHQPTSVEYFFEMAKKPNLGFYAQGDI